MRRPTILTVLLAALALPAATAHAADELYVQDAASATTTMRSATRGTLTLHDAPATVLAFDDRPQRRSRRVGLATYLSLWKGAFATDPPNAALTGRDRSGRRRETVVELVGARRSGATATYAIRARDGVPPRALRDVRLFVDPADVDTINAVYFPSQEEVQAFENVVVSPATPFIVSPGQYVFGSLELRPGAQMQLPAEHTVFLYVPGSAANAVLAAASRRPVASAVDAGGTAVLCFSAGAAVTLAAPATAPIVLAPVTVSVSP